MSGNTASRTTYKAAGVDIDAATEAVGRMKAHVARTRRAEVLADVGPFGGCFALSRAGILVASADGVGTKLKIAFMMDKHDTVGIDCVAMNVNDVLTAGAEPLFFLDYIATSKVEPEKIEAIVKGVAEGCVRAGCSLLGGETAEMPGLYAEGEYDLAGFAVGVVVRRGSAEGHGGAQDGGFPGERPLDGTGIRPGDVILGLASTGLHSNGYSLARKVLFEKGGLSVDSYVADLGRSLGEELLEPTKIYVKSVLRALVLGREIVGIAHVTGGGFIDNIPRILPPGLKAVIRRKAWPVPPVFHLIASLGDVDEEEMFRVFNMGIGMILVVGERDSGAVASVLHDSGETVYEIGFVAPARTGDRTVEFV